MQRVRHRERSVPADACCRERTRIVIASHPDPRTGGRWAARCGAAGKDLDNNHVAATARAWWAMIGRGVRIGGAVIVHCRWIDAVRAAERLSFPFVTAFVFNLASTLDILSGAFASASHRADKTFAICTDHVLPQRVAFALMCSGRALIGW